MSNAIYKPKGKAGEYAEWACNLYVGCSNDCAYCYCKKGVLSHAMGGPVPKLKTCFRDEDHALDVFSKELKSNLSELQKSSLFFTFSSDPMIPETFDLNLTCVLKAVNAGVRCQILTKNADFIYRERMKDILIDANGVYRKHIAFGFTLTGRDDLEPGASSNAKRVDSMLRLKLMGFRTFASLEPVVDPVSTLSVFYQIEDCCDLFKIGLQSGVPKDYYHLADVRKMAEIIAGSGKPVYFKKSITDYLGWDSHEPVDIFKLK